MANDVYTANADGSCRVGRFNISLLQQFISSAQTNQWLEYSGTNINTKYPAYSVDRQDISILETDETRLLTNWANCGGYDKSRKVVNFVGTSEGYFAGVKNYRGKLVRFNLNTNEFTVDYGPLPLINEGHIYDRNSKAPDNQGRFYCTALVSTGSPKIYRRELTGEYVEIFTLSTSNVSGMSSGNLLCALDVFPTMGDEGSVITFGQRGALVRYDIASGNATLLHTAATDNRHYYGICVYVPAIDKVVFGGGETSQELFTLDSSGTVVQLNNAIHPINVKSGNYKYIPSPVLLEPSAYSLEIDTGKMYRHNLSDDTWTEIGAIPPVSTLTQTVFIPLWGLNSIMCLNGQGRVAGETTSKVFIYKLREFNENWPLWRNQVFVNTWVNPSTSTMSSINPENDPAINPNYPSASPWKGIGGQGTLVSAWCGAVADEQRNTFNIHNAGGHGDSGENSHYQYDLSADSPVFTLLRKPSGSISAEYPSGFILDDGLEQTSVYADGFPRSRHTYNKHVYDTTSDEIVLVVAGSCFSSAAYFEENQRVERFNPTNGNFIGASVQTTFAANGTSSGGGGCYDSLRDCYWWMNRGSSQKMVKYDKLTQSWSRGSNNLVVPTGTAPNFNYKSLTYLSHIDRIFITDGNELAENDQERAWLYNPNDDTFIEISLNGTSVGCCLSGDMQPAYSAERKEIYYWNNSSNTAVINYISIPDDITATWVISQLSVSPVNNTTPSSKTTRGTYGRFRYFPQLDGFALLNSNEEPLYFYARS